MNRGFCIVLFMAFTFAMANSAAAAQLYENQRLLAAPDVHAKVIGLAKKGSVKVVKRRGYWVKIKAGSVVGWTMLSHVKMKESMVWMPVIDTLRDTGRLAAGH